MVPKKINNWLIDQTGIKWAGQPEIDYLIPKEELIKSGFGNRKNMYDWLVHMVEKTWLTRTDIYALNTALIYAIEEFKISFPEDLSFIATFNEQDKELVANKK